MNTKFFYETLHDFNQNSLSILSSLEKFLLLDEHYKLREHFNIVVNNNKIGNPDHKIIVDKNHYLIADKKIKIPPNEVFSLNEHNPKTFLIEENFTKLEGSKRVKAIFEFFLNEENGRIYEAVLMINPYFDFNNLKEKEKIGIMFIDFSLDKSISVCLNRSLPPNTSEGDGVEIELLDTSMNGDFVGVAIENGTFVISERINFIINKDVVGPKETSIFDMLDI